jgi:hypothetical protein
LGIRVQGLKFMVRGQEYGIQGQGLLVTGLGLRDSWFRVWRFGCRIKRAGSAGSVGSEGSVGSVESTQCVDLGVGQSVQGLKGL